MARTFGKPSEAPCLFVIAKRCLDSKWLWTNFVSLSWRFEWEIFGEQPLVRRCLVCPVLVHNYNFVIAGNPLSLIKRVWWKKLKWDLEWKHENEIIVTTTVENDKIPVDTTLIHRITPCDADLFSRFGFWSCLAFQSIQSVYLELAVK